MRLGLPAGIAVALATLAGCEDASVDPAALLVAPETRAALEFATKVQLLPDLMTKHEIEDRVAPAIGLWTESWDEEPEAGSLLRRRAYRIASRELAEVALPLELWESLSSLEQLIGSAQALGSGPLPVDLQVAVDRARTLHERAEDALASGSSREAIELAFESSDALRAVGAEAVVNRLLREVEESLDSVSARRNEVPSAYDQVDVERAERMTRGAREAREDGEYELAIRRAFYAWQILQEGEP